MLLEERYEPEVIRNLGDELIYSPEMDKLEIPDEIWGPFEKAYNEADPSAAENVSVG